MNQDNPKYDEDVELGKLKSPRDILIGYALLLPTLIGIVTAADNGTLLYYQSKVKDLLNGLPQDMMSGQKLVNALIRRFGDPKNVSSSRTIIDEHATKLRKEGRLTHDELAVKAETLSKNLSARRDAVEAIQPTPDLENALLSRQSLARKLRDEGLKSTIEVRGKKLRIKRIDEINERINLVALIRAYKVDLGATYALSQYTNDDLRSLLGNRELDPGKITDITVLDKYIRNIKSIRRQYTIKNIIGDAAAPKPGSVTNLKLQQANVLISNGKVTTAGTADPVQAILKTLTSVEGRGEIDEIAVSQAQRKLTAMIKSQETILERANLGPLWSNYYSPEAQAKSINRAYQEIKRRVAYMAKKGGVFEGATTELVMEEQRTFNMPIKYYKIVIKAKNGTPLELPLPTTQLGYTFLEPGRLPATTKLNTMGHTISGIQGPTSQWLMRLPHLTTKALNDYAENLSGGQASNVWLRSLQELLSTQAPATLTRGDILKQGILSHTGIKLLAGMGGRDYTRAYEADLTVRTWRNSYNRAGVRFISFDTEFMSPDGMKRSEGIRMVDRSGAQVWQLGFEVIDPKSRQSIHNAGKTLYIRPNNWNEIRDDVHMFLMKNLSGSQSSREKAADSILKTVDKLDSRESLITALKALEKEINRKPGITYFIGQAHVKFDIPALVNTIDNTLSPKEAKEWKTRLSVMLNTDSSSSTYRHVDIMKWFQGYKLGDLTSAAANNYIFAELYGGVSMDEFADLVKTMQRPDGTFDTDKKGVIKEIKKILGMRRNARVDIKSRDNQIINNTWAVYKRFVSSKFSSGVDFSAHIDARFDSIITALNAFKLMDIDINPTAEYSRAMVRMEDAAEVYRKMHHGFGLPFDQLNNVYERPEYAYMVREPLYELFDNSAIDPDTGMLKYDDYYKADLFSVTHRQAALANAGLFHIERLVPGGLLNNVLRTKFQVFNSSYLSIDTSIMSRVKTTKAGERAMRGRKDIISDLGPLIANTTYSTVIESTISNELRLGMATTLPTPPSLRRGNSVTSETLRVPTLFLPDHLSIVNSEKSYINQQLSRGIFMHKYGSGPAHKVIKINLPMNSVVAELELDKAKGAAVSVADLLRQMRIREELAEPFRDVALFDPTDGSLIRNRVVGTIEKPIVLRPGMRLFGGPMAGQEGTSYKSMVNGQLMEISFDPENKQLLVTVTRPSPLAAGSKAIAGVNMINKSIIHSTIPADAAGFGKIGFVTGYRFGGKRNELGALLEIQINRVLDRIYTLYPRDTVKQEQAIKRALEPLFGDAIVPSHSLPGSNVRYPTVRLEKVPIVGIDGGPDGYSVAVRLTDRANVQLYERATEGIYSPILEMLDEAGVDYNYVKKRFLAQAREVTSNKREALNEWKNVVKRGKTFLSDRIAIIQDQLDRGGGTKAERSLLNNELGFLRNQLRALETGQGPLLWDPAIVSVTKSTASKRSSRMKEADRMVVFEAFRAGVPLYAVETAPYDFAREFIRRDSKTGVPLGPSKTSTYNALVLRNTLHMLEGVENPGAADSIIAQLESQMGFIRKSIYSPQIAKLGQQLAGLNIARAKLIYGSAKKILKNIPNTVIEKLSPEGLREVAEAIRDSKTDLAIDYINKEFGLSLSGSSSEWADELEAQLEGRPDLYHRAEQIKALTRSKRITILEANSINPITMGENPNATLFEIPIFSLNRVKVSKKQEALRQLKRIAKEADSRPGGLLDIFNEIEFDIQKDVIDKLRAEGYGKNTRELKQLLSISDKLKGSGPVKQKSLLLPKLTGALELHAPNTAIDGKAGEFVVSGGIQQKIMDIIQVASEVERTGTEVQSIMQRIADDERSISEELKEDAVAAMKEYHAKRRMLQRLVSNDLFQDILTHSYSLTIQKSLTTWSPITYGKLFGHEGVVSTLSRLYSSIEDKDRFGAKGNIPNFSYLNSELGITDKNHKRLIHKAVFKDVSGQPVHTVEYDIRKSFYNLVANTGESVSKENPLFSTSGRILFKGLGINQTIIPYSTAKAVLQNELSNGGKLTQEAIDWLQGKTSRVVGLNRDPIHVQNLFGITAAYVAPDELWSLMGFPKGTQKAVVLVDQLTQAIIDADFDGDIGFLLSLGNTTTAEAAQLSNKHTAYVIKRHVRQNMLKGLKGDEAYRLKFGEVEIPDARVLLNQLVELNEGDGPVVYKSTIQNVSFTLTGKEDIDTGSAEDLMPESLYKAFTKSAYENIRTHKVDEYLTQKLLTGPIGALNKFYNVQILNPHSSAYTSIRNMAVKEDGAKVINKILTSKGLRDSGYLKNAESLIAFVDLIYKEPQGMMPFSISESLTTWSGRVQHGAAIAKVHTPGEDTRQVVNKYLRTYRGFVKGFNRKPFKQIDKSIDMLVWNESNKDMSFLTYYYNPELYGGKSLEELDEATFRRVHKEATDILKADYALRQVGMEANTNDFQWSFLRDSLRGSQAQIRYLLNEDYQLSSGIMSAMAPWAKQLGFNAADDAALIANQYSRGGALFQRRTVVEMLKDEMKEIFKGSYSVLGKNIKVAGIIALGAMALDPNANSMLLGHQAGRGGEEFDLPGFRGLLRSRKPTIIEPSAPFLDKLNYVSGLPQTTVPQLRMEDNPLPPRPPIRYTARRKNSYNRLNISQAIKGAEVIRLS